MKPIIVALAAVFAISAGCGTVTENVSQFEATGDHFQAQQCELRLDGVHVWRSSHNMRTIEFRLQTSEEVEAVGVDKVGMRHAATYDTTLSAELDYDYRDEAAKQGDDGFYRLAKIVTGEFGAAVFRGAFFVKTKEGTTYWLQPAPLVDYVVDEPLFTQVLENSQTPELGTAEVLVQDSPRLAEFDPHGCSQ